MNDTFIQIETNLKNVGPLFFKFTRMQSIFYLLQLCPSMPLFGFSVFDVSYFSFKPSLSKTMTMIMIINTIIIIIIIIIILSEIT